MATPDLRAAAQETLAALSTCRNADYSTGHVIPPSFDEKLVDAACISLARALSTPSAVAAEDARVPPELDVRKILIDVVPGEDGMGHEVYAKTVADVENELSRLGAALEDLQLTTPHPAPAVANKPAAYKSLKDGELFTVSEAEFLYPDAHDRCMAGIIPLVPAGPITAEAPAVDENAAVQALDQIDDFIARCNGDDRGACEPVNVLRAYLNRAAPAVAAEAGQVTADDFPKALDRACLAVGAAMRDPGFNKPSDIEAARAYQGNHTNVARKAINAWLKHATQPAPVAEAGQEEREAFEAWIRKDCGDLSTFGTGRNMHYSNSAVNNAWTGWQARATQPAPPSQGQWLPIKTAPNNTELLVGRWVSDEWRICQSGYYFDAGNELEGEPAYWYWHCDWDTGGVTDDEGPSHWTPLPAAPTQPPAEGG